MKTFLAIALATIMLSTAPPAAADRKGHHHFRGHDRTVIIHHYAHPHPYKHRHRVYHKRHYHGRDYRPHYYRHAPPVVHKHYYRDDSYKWIGGMYILDELLHHHHH